jgi:hypothetical protein
MWIWFAAYATAADPVVHDGLDEVAVQRAAESTQKPMDDFRAVDIGDALTGTPPYLEGGLTRACRGTTTTQSELAALLAEIEGAVNYFELERGAKGIDEATKVLACLGEPLNSDTAARLHFLAGFLAAQSENETSARAQFLRALDFDPDLAWDEDLPPDGRQLFESLRDTVERPISLVMRPEGADALLDGHSATDAIRAGLHYVQGGEPIVTQTIDVVGGGTLVVPSTLGPEVLDWIGGDRQGDLADLLGRAFPDHATVYVARPDGLWMGVPGNRTWIKLGTYDPSLVATSETEKPTRPKSKGRGLIVAAAGGGLAMLGGLVSGVTYAKGEGQKQDLYETEFKDELSHFNMTDPYYRSLRANRAGWVVAGIGVAAAGTGLGLHFGARW